MTNSEDPQGNVPSYGTPEYAEWYAKRFPEYMHAAPRVGQPGTPRNWEPPKPSHKRRNIVLSLFASVVVLLGVVGAITSSSGGGDSASGHEKPIVSTMDTADPPIQQAPAVDPSAFPSAAQPSENAAESAAPHYEPAANELQLTTGDGGEATLRLTRLESRTSDWPAEYDGDDMASPKYGRFIAVTVNIQCTKGTIDYNPYDWQFEAANGQLFDEENGNAEDVNFDYDLQLDSGTLHPGQQVQGALLFDIPAGAGKVEMTDFNGTIGGWTVSVR